MFAVDLLDRGDTTNGTNGVSTDDATLSAPSGRPANSLNDFDGLPKVEAEGVDRIFLLRGSSAVGSEAPVFSSDASAISANIPERKADP